VLEDRFCPATDYVTTDAATGDGSLSQVIANAAANDMIEFQLPQGMSTTITLNSSITINKPLTINGLNYGQAGQSVTLSGAGFAIATTGPNDSVEIDNLNLTNGSLVGIGNGAAISDAVNGSTLTLNNDVFSGNAANNGGAIYYSTNEGTLNLNNDQFSGNIATGNNGLGDGGALYVAGNANINNSKFYGNTPGQGNTAEQNGAAIHAGPLSGGAGSGDLSVQNSQFGNNGNQVTIGQVVAGQVNNGGAIYASGSSVSLTNDAFGSNNAYASGGAVYATPGTYNNVSLYVFDSSFMGNQAKGSPANSQGGAIFTQDTTTVGGDGNTNYPAQFVGNYATDGGGAIAHLPIQNTSSTPNVYNITFNGNTAGEYGGALFEYLNNNSTTPTSVGVNVSGSLFTGNKVNGGWPSGDFGGAVYIGQNTGGQASASFIAMNSTFYQNTSDGCGGAIADESGGPANTITLTSLTVTGNTAATYGGGLYVGGGYTAPLFDNSIIAGNTLGAGDPVSNGYDVYGAVQTAGYNVVGMANGSTGFSITKDYVGTDTQPVDPGLDPNGLQPNGGPTLTIALLKTSNYYQRGDQNLANQTDGSQKDQRGYNRSPGMVSPGAEDPAAQP
jgi:predicted outer membrane repeat protein